MTTPRYEITRLAFDWGDISQLHAFTMAGWKIVHVADGANRGLDRERPNIALLERPIPSLDICYPGRYNSPYAGPWSCSTCQCRGIGWDEAQLHYRDVSHSGQTPHTILFDYDHTSQIRPK